MELFSPTFWAFVLVMAAVLVAAYFILRQALLDALTEWSKRERDEEEARRRGAKR